MSAVPYSTDDICQCPLTVTPNDFSVAPLSLTFQGHGRYICVKIIIIIACRTINIVLGRIVLKSSSIRTWTNTFRYVNVVNVIAPCNV